MIGDPHVQKPNVKKLKATFNICFDDEHEQMYTDFKRTYKRSKYLLKFDDASKCVTLTF